MTTPVGIQNWNGFAREELIRFQHCDPAGIVFYPRYVEMINATVEDWFAAVVGISFAEIHMDLNVAIPCVALNVEFTAPSRLGETLRFEVEVKRIGNTSATLEIGVFCLGEPRLTATTTLVHVSKAGYRPLPWPQTFRDGMTRSSV